MRNQHPVWHAGYWEWEALLFGALLVALAVGALFATVFSQVAAYFIIAGVPLHVWGMYRVYRQNPRPSETIRGFRPTTPAAAAGRR